MAGRISLAQRRRLLPYLLIAPGLTWLVVFYLIPALNQVYVSLEDGNIEEGYTFQWNWATYSSAIDDYSEQFVRSLGYAGVATLLAFVIAFAQGAAYDSPNFLWFRDRMDGFAYIDRIVVAEAGRGRPGRPARGRGPWPRSGGRAPAPRESSSASARSSGRRCSGVPGRSFRGICRLGAAATS